MKLKRLASIFLAALAVQFLQIPRVDAVSISVVLDPGGNPVFSVPGELSQVELEFRESLTEGTWGILPGNQLSRITTVVGLQITHQRASDSSSGFYRLRYIIEPSSGVLAYDIGNPRVDLVWVDPVAGDDSRTGMSSATALHTLTEAWNRIPSGRLSTRGFQIMIMPGKLPESSLPNFLEEKQGTFQFPIIIQSSQGPGKAILGGDLNFFKCSYVYLIDLDIVPEPSGDTLHLELCDHFLMRGVVMNGGVWFPDTTNSVAHDNLKINQSQYIYIEGCNVFGADDNAIDLVAVQYGHIVRTKAHNCNDWAAYAKGGSAYLTIEGNEFYDAGTGGFTAGQGTGFQFMTPPWLHYEAYDFKIINNFVHDVNGAGIGVNGGFNILIAHNTIVRAGSRSHLIEFAFGNRSCDGHPGDEGYEEGRNICATNLLLGGWGTTLENFNDDFAYIPNRNVLVTQNVFYNPDGFNSGEQIFQIPGPYSGTNQIGSNVEVPTHADTGLVIQGNVFWTQDEVLAGLDNSRLNETEIRANNAIQSFKPEFVNEAAGDFRPKPGGNLAVYPVSAIPDFSWADAPTRPQIPEGNNNNQVRFDRVGKSRSSPSVAGAYLP